MDQIQADIKSIEELITDLTLKIDNYNPSLNMRSVADFTFSLGQWVEEEVLLLTDLIKLTNKWSALPRGTQMKWIEEVNRLAEEINPEPVPAVETTPEEGQNHA